jgi:site-specific recombinase XerD
VTDIYGDGLPGGPYRTEDIGYLVEHLNWMRRCDRADSTMKARRMVLTWLAEYLGHDPATATADQLDAWQSQLPTINAVRWQTAMIRPYYAYLHSRGLRPDNPAALLPRPKARRRLPRPIPDDRLFAAIAAAPPRVLPWLLLAGWAGLRASEIAGLHVENFGRDPDGGIWVRIIGKGDAERDVAVPRWLWLAIAPNLPAGPCWARAHGRGPVTGRHVSDNCRYYLGVKCGLPDRLHSLRHRVATAVLRQTRDVRLVQDLLGHANLGTIDVYTRVQPIEMTRAVEALPKPIDLAG